MFALRWPFLLQWLCDNNLPSFIWNSTPFGRALLDAVYDKQW